MSKNKRNSSSNKNHAKSSEAAFLNNMKEYDFGEGVEIITGTSYPGGPTKVETYRKLFIPDSKAPLVGSTRLTISFSSVEQDNAQLLHFLLNKSK